MNKLSFTKNMPIERKALIKYLYKKGMKPLTADRFACRILNSIKGI